MTMGHYVDGKWQSDDPMELDADGYFAGQDRAALVRARDEIARLRAEIDRKDAALRLFLEDDRFQVAVGGNPIAIEKMLAQARAALGEK